MPPKSVYRQPGAKHFQLVYRSQRDPLIHDPEASQHVLKAFERGNTAKGKSRADLELALSHSDLAHDQERSNIGEAALYGVYYDDTNYDYMQHLRTVGLQEDGVDTILVEAPSKSKVKGRAKDLVTLLELPPEALPSASEVPRNYESQEVVPSSIAGFRPDMDPHLRQVLEALEDDAFVDDDLEDDFFGELVAEGERGADEDVEFEFLEEGITQGMGKSDEKDRQAGEEEEDASWEVRFERFKKAQQTAAPSSDTSDVDAYSDGGDTVGTLPQFSVIGGKRRRKGTSDASGYSMSSSSMFRNEGLTTLDERFDQIQKEYESDHDEDVNVPPDDSEEVPELITSREDFDAIMNEFLDNYEILGGKLRHVLPGETGADKLDAIRKGLGAATLRDQDGDSEEDDIMMPLDIDERKDRWDCETILTTYSNLENHPRQIRARQDKRVLKIRLDPKTGLPVIEGKQPTNNNDCASSASGSDDEADTHSHRVAITRPKNESKEDKKARKQAVKAERQVRRADKKATKEQFLMEAKRQTRTLAYKEKTRVKKL
ncbi:hypothetical protein AcW1_001147 [Taiwanofungus camphoratus]|nr:hypothetical protein AcW1_001147 [Antrodia cinnamomea]